MFLEFNNVTIILMYLAIILLSRFLMTRLTKLLQLPDVSGYILAGILIGPYGLSLLNMEIIYHMDFLGDIALAFIAFDVGKFLNYDIFKKSGEKTIIVTLFESLLTGFMITIFMYYLFGLDLSFALLLGAIGTATAICSMFNISPLLASMVYGASYMNITRDIELFNQINEFTPPIFSLFFILSGMKLDIGVLASLGLTGVAYFIIRIIGKYIGAYLGSYVVNMDKDIRKYLGLDLIPQAGVAIGLAFLGQRMLPLI